MSQSTEKTVNRVVQIDAAKDAIRQVWLAGLGTIEMFQTRRNQVFDKLVGEGEKFRTRNRKAAVEKLEAVQEETREVWHRIDRALQGRVSSVLNWLRIPTKADVENLSKRVDVLDNSINGLTHPDGTRPSDRTRKSKLTAAA